MNRWAGLILKGAAAATCASAQVTIMPAVAISGVKPDLPLILVLVIGLSHGAREAAWWGAAVGLGLDACSFAPFGTHIVLTALGGLAVGSLQGQVNRQYPLVPLSVCLAVAALHAVAYWIVQMAAWSGFQIRQAMVGQALAGMAYSAVTALAVFYGYQRLLGWRDRRRARRRPWSV